METTTVDITQTPAKVYKARVEKIRNTLPRNYREIFYRHHPEFNTVKGRKLLDNVIQLKRTHVAATEILEKIHSKELL